MEIHDRRYKIGLRLGKEVQRLKGKCDAPGTDFNSKSDLLIERYMKMIRKLDEAPKVSGFLFA